MAYLLRDRHLVETAEVSDFLGAKVVPDDVGARSPASALVHPAGTVVGREYRQPRGVVAGSGQRVQGTVVERAPDAMPPLCGHNMQRVQLSGGKLPVGSSHDRPGRAAVHRRQQRDSGRVGKGSQPLLAQFGRSRHRATGEERAVSDRHSSPVNLGNYRSICTVLDYDLAHAWQRMLPAVREYRARSAATVSQMKRVSLARL